MAVRTDLIQWHTQQDKSISDINIQLYFKQKKTEQWTGRNSKCI